MLPDDPRHGTYAGTVAHWKSGTPICEPCRTAGRKADKLVRHDRHNGNPRTVPLGKRAWDVVHTSPRDQLSRATGLRVDKIIRLDGRGPEQLVLRTTRDRILAAEMLDFWTAIGIQRRLRALTARGWSMRALAAETGIHVDCLKRCRIRENPQFARREFALPLIEAYDRLHMTSPQGKGATRARNEAVANGWAPPFAFDNIDDPNEQPTGAGHIQRKQQPGAIILAEWDHLRASGESIHAAATQLGVTVCAIEQAEFRSRRDGAA